MNDNTNQEKIRNIGIKVHSNPIMKGVLDRRPFGRGTDTRSMFTTAFLAVPLLFDISQGVAAVLFFMLCMIPFFSALGYGKEEGINWVPILLISFSYFLGFPWSFINRNVIGLSSLDHLGDTFINDALLWSCRGFTLFLLAYFYGRGLFRKAKKKTLLFGSSIEMHNALRFIFVLGLLSFIGTVLSLIAYKGAPFFFIERTEVGLQDGSMNMILHYLVNLSYPFFFLYMLFRLKGIRRQGLDRIFYLSFLLYIIGAIGSGAKVIFLSLILCFLLPIFTFQVKFSIKKAFYCLLGFIIAYSIFNIVTNYRDLVRLNPPEERGDIITTLEYQIKTFGKALKLNVLKMGGFETELTYLGDSTDGSERVLKRLGSALVEFASLLQISGGMPPYDNAISTFFVPVYAVIPRAIYEEKPRFFDAGLHAQYYGWFYGGISVTLIGSLYWSWGYIGVCIGMMITGFTLALFIEIMSFRSQRWVVGASIFFLFFINIVDPGVTFHAIFMNLTRHSIILLFLYKISSLRIPRFIIPNPDVRDRGN